MNKIKNYDEFLKENFLSLEESEQYLLIEEALHTMENEEDLNEGLKDILMAGLMSLLTVGGVNAQTIKTVDRKVEKTGLFNQNTKTDLTKAYKFNLDSTMTKEKADEIIAKMLKKGWSMKGSALDTLWTKVSAEAPDTKVDSIAVKFDSGNYFASGKYDLDAKMKSDIDGVLQEVVSRGGTLVKMNVVASTDKQGLSKGLKAKLIDAGFTGDNTGLSKARSGNVKAYLESLGVDSSLIEEKNLAEQGTQEVDSSARYVLVQAVYLVASAPAKTVAKEEPKSTVDYTVYLNKQIITKKQWNWNFHFPHFYKKCGTIKNYSTRKQLSCPVGF